MKNNKTIKIILIFLVLFMFSPYTFADDIMDGIYEKFYQKYETEYKQYLIDNNLTEKEYSIVTFLMDKGMDFVGELPEKGMEKLDDYINEMKEKTEFGEILREEAKYYNFKEISTDDFLLEDNVKVKIYQGENEYSFFCGDYKNLTEESTFYLEVLEDKPLDYYQPFQITVLFQKTHMTLDDEPACFLKFHDNITIGAHDWYIEKTGQNAYVAHYYINPKYFKLWWDPLIEINFNAREHQEFNTGILVPTDKPEYLKFIDGLDGSQHYFVEETAQFGKDAQEIINTVIDYSKSRMAENVGLPKTDLDNYWNFSYNCKNIVPEESISGKKEFEIEVVANLKDNDFLNVDKKFYNYGFINKVIEFDKDGKSVLVSASYGETYQIKLEDKSELESEIRNKIDSNIKKASLAVLSSTSYGIREHMGDFIDVLQNIVHYKPGELDAQTSNKVENIISKMLTAVTNIGMIVSVLILAILGIKYMLGSVEEKAEYKKDLLPYLIGAILLFGILTFIKIFMSLGEKISNL